VPERYRFQYQERSVFEKAIGLLSRLRNPDGKVVIDLGCGYGAIAELVRDAGLTYLGFDVDAAAVNDLRARGFEATIADLSDGGRAATMIEHQLGSRSLTAIVMIDVLEHLTNGAEILSSMQRLALARGGVPLILAVPNITHVDMAGKLLLGRWDVTPTGLVDDTHVAFFSARRLDWVTQSAGWVQIAEDDFELPESDQHFPGDVAVLQSGAPLRELLYEVRDQAGAGVIVNEFVRAYAPLAVPLSTEVADPNSPFLSVLVRTQAARQATLEDTLLSLAAQTVCDFEVIVLAHDVPRQSLSDLQYLIDAFPEELSAQTRLVPVDGGGRSRPLNVGIDLARGDYVAILDDDDVVFAHWVETFREMARRRPGRVIRTVPAEHDVRPATWSASRQGYEVVSAPRCRWASEFDLLEHLFENQSPPCSWAVPRSAFRDLGIRFDEALPVLEDWDVLLRAALWCGVADVKEVTSIWRRWKLGDSSTSVHTEFEWSHARSAVVAKLDAAPLLLPERSLTALHRLFASERQAGGEIARLRSAVDSLKAERDALAIRCHEASRELEEFRRSTSWKATAPLRMLGRWARRAAGHGH